MSWYLVAYLWTLQALDTIGVTPAGLKVFAVAILIGIAIGILV